MVRGHCKACKALMYTPELRYLCDACTEAANERARLAHEAEQEQFDNMSEAEREIYYASAEVAWRQEQHGRLDA